jgi:tetratricopeptide (TPR) repeat protein
MTHWRSITFLLLAVFFGCVARGADPIAVFDQANRLYEQGKYSEAARAYQQIISLGKASATVYYNLGNAWFKAGQLGRAVAAYRRAEDLAPRDPNIRFNLNFTRKQITGSESPPAVPWHRWFERLTVNEWTVVAAVALWIFFLLLALREGRPNLRKPLGGYATASGLAALLLSGALGFTLYERSRTAEAVVTTPQAVVRYGPLDDSRVHYQLRDGSEVIVLDEKRLGPSESWVQVRDASRRVGWLKRDQVIIL